MDKKELIDAHIRQNITDFLYGYELKYDDYFIYKDFINKQWISCIEDKMIAIPFGFYFVDIMNQLQSYKSLDSFMSYERTIRASKPNRDINYYKPTRIFLPTLLSNDYRSGFDEISDEQLENLYNHLSFIYSKCEKDIESFNDFLKLYIQGNDNFHVCTAAYNIFYSFLLRVFYLFTYESVMNPAPEYIEKFGDLAKEQAQNELKEYDDFCKRIEENGYIEKLIRNSYKNCGYETLTIDNKKIPCEKYSIWLHVTWIANDLMMLLTNINDFSLGFCKNCGLLYVVYNKNQKYCPSCASQNYSFNNTKRKDNAARYIHKKITDFINVNLDIDTEDFRNESNYYWSLVRKKCKEVNPEYSQDINTEKKYIKWLNEQMEYYKSLK